MDSLITDIEMSMMTNQASAKKDVAAAVGEYYLVSISDCWFRVRVVEINYETNQCQCFFIDIGDSEQLALDQLYRCEPQYLDLPAQAICFTLEGLEDFSENPTAKHILGQRINHRVLIGMILSKREEYEQAEQRDGIGSSSLKVVLYDTSSAEDEVVNPILLQQICKSMPVPELNRKSVNYVSITYVDDQGDVYCQKDGAMNYIQVGVAALRVRSVVLGVSHLVVTLDRGSVKGVELLSVRCAVVQFLLLFYCLIAPLVDWAIARFGVLRSVCLDCFWAVHLRYNAF